jgi:hypothetical protein
VVAETSLDRLSLVIVNKGRTCLVYVMGLLPTNDFTALVGCDVRIRGINASKPIHGRLAPASIFAPGLSEVTALGRSTTNWSDLPVISIDALMEKELGSWTNEPVRVNGVIAAYKPGESLVVKDATGLVRAEVIQNSAGNEGDRVDVWGYLTVLPQETVLREAYFEIQHSLNSTDRASLAGQSVPAQSNDRPEITRFSVISKMRLAEASQGFPVRLRGVVTYADVDWHNCFIQNQGGALYVDLSREDVRAGQWVELTGRTSPGGFAPEITNASFHILGISNLPPPIKVDLEDLANGHLDSHWVQVEGVIRRVTEQLGHVTLDLTTPKGRFKAIVLKSADQPLKTNLIDASVSVQGACTSQMNTRNQLTGISLRVPSFQQIAVLEPVPSNPFAVQATDIGSVGTFDLNRLAGRRLKINGIVTLILAGEGFFVQDHSGGIKVKSPEIGELEIGDSIDILGFPTMGDFSPFLEEVIFQRIGRASLPKPNPTTAEEILSRGANDASLVRIDAQLLQSIPRSAHPKLVLQAGAIIFTAHFATQILGTKLVVVQARQFASIDRCVFDSGRRKP